MKDFSKVLKYLVRLILSIINTSWLWSGLAWGIWDWCPFLTDPQKPFPPIITEEKNCCLDYMVGKPVMSGRSTACRSGVVTGTVCLVTLHSSRNYFSEEKLSWKTEHAGQSLWSPRGFYLLLSQEVLWGYGQWYFLGYTRKQMRSILPFAHMIPTNANPITSGTVLHFLTLWWVQSCYSLANPPSAWNSSPSQEQGNYQEHQVQRNE